MLIVQPYAVSNLVRITGMSLAVLYLLSHQWRIQGSYWGCNPALENEEICIA